MPERIEFGETLYALIIRADFSDGGIHFFTPHEFSQQLAYMSRPSGYRIQPHYHRKISRQVFLTQEVLFIKTGRIRVDFFDEDQAYLGNTILSAGDVILLCEGGHGFEVIEQCEMIEVKQGPYLGEDDKVRFSADS